MHTALGGKNVNNSRRRQSLLSAVPVIRTTDLQKELSLNGQIREGFTEEVSSESRVGRHGGKSLNQSMDWKGHLGKREGPAKLEQRGMSVAEVAWGRDAGRSEVFLVAGCLHLAQESEIDPKRCGSQ